MSIILPGSETSEQPPACPPEASLSIHRGAGLPADEALPMAARAGFRRVELGTEGGELADPRRLVGLGLNQLRKSLRETELATASLLTTATVAATNAQDRRQSCDDIRAAVDLADSLECGLVVVRAPQANAHPDAARYALDTLHDVATALSRSGVRLALTTGGGFLSDPSARERLLAEAPDEVGLALADQDLQSTLKDAPLGALAARALNGRLGARALKQSLELSDGEAARALIQSLGRGHFGGELTVRPQAELCRTDMLSRLYESLHNLVPQAYLSGMEIS